MDGRAGRDLVGRIVISARGRYIGTVGCVWGNASDQSGMFLGVRTLGLPGEPRIVPLAPCRVEGTFVRTPFHCAAIHGAPRAAPSEILQSEVRFQVLRHYGLVPDPVGAPV